MAAWICPTCRIHYGETQAGICPADGTRLVMNLSGAQLVGNTLTHLLHVGPDGSTIWEAATAQGTRVAMKLLRGPQDATAWSTAALLSHPRIVALRGYASIDEDLACVVMQWLEGRTLAETLSEGPLPVPLALRLADELLDALEYVHGRDLVHGDLHAETVFLERGDHLKLLDVGVRRARPLAEILGLGRRPLDWYTVLYAPPERLATGRTDQRGDLYGVATLLWHMCVGAPPFGIDPQSVARHHLTAPRPRLSDVHHEGGWPPGLQEVLERAMAIRPEGRFESATEMRTALAQTLASAVASPPRPAPPLQVSAPVEAAVVAVAAPVGPAGPSQRTLVRLAAGAAALLGVALVWRLLPSEPAAEPRPDRPAFLAGPTTSWDQVPPTAPAEVVEATPIQDDVVDAALPAPDAGSPLPDGSPPDAGAVDANPPVSPPDASPPDARVPSAPDARVPSAPDAAPPIAIAPPSVARVEAHTAVAQPTRGGSTDPHRRRPRVSRSAERIVILGSEKEVDRGRPARVPVLE